MTLLEITEVVARRVDSTYREAYGFIATATEVTVERLDLGEEVHIRGLGTFKWVPVPGKRMYSLKEREHVEVKPGYKLRFVPADRFKTRRSLTDAQPGTERGNDQTRGRPR